MSGEKVTYITMRIKDNKFPKSLLALQIFLCFITSGVHYGLIVLGDYYDLNVVYRVLIPVIYWILFSVFVTLYIRRLIKITYEIPLKNLSKATSKVARGDFSVVLEPVHSPDKYDYLDALALDFNRMVTELSGIETIKNDFIANVSHEFKTPIAIIQNNAEYLKNTALTDTQKECVDVALKSCHRLSSLVTNILKLSKLENQTIIPIFESYNVCEQLAECALEYENILEDNGVTIEAEMDDTALIYADKNLMAIVWTNILSNAAKFTSQGSIYIKQYSDNGKTYISIKDTGCGMKKDDIDRIFDKFYQIDSSHSTIGNGLGLALVKKILSLHGFNIKVESEINVGSTFTIII